MKATPLFKRSLVAPIVFAAVVFAMGSSSEARAAADSEIQFGMISLDAGQSVRFSGMNVALGDGSVRATMRFDIYSLGGPDTAPGCSPSAVASCTNNLRWIKTETCRVNLRSRAGATCEILADRPGLIVNVSMLIEGYNPATRMISNIEVRENNRTVLVHPGVARGFDPQPEPPSN